MVTRDEARERLQAAWDLIRNPRDSARKLGTEIGEFRQNPTIVGAEMQLHQLGQQLLETTKQAGQRTSEAARQLVQKATLLIEEGILMKPVNELMHFYDLPHALELSESEHQLLGAFLMTELAYAALSGGRRSQRPENNGVRDFITKGETSFAQRSIAQLNLQQPELESLQKRALVLRDFSQTFTGEIVKELGGHITVQQILHENEASPLEHAGAALYGVWKRLPEHMADAQAIIQEYRNRLNVTDFSQAQEQPLTA